MTVLGNVVTVNENIVEGNVNVSVTHLALIIDGIERQRIVLGQAPSSESLNRSFKFYPRSLKVEPGIRIVEVCPVSAGAVGHPLPGVGVTHTSFDLEVSFVEINVPELVRQVEDAEVGRKDIRRFLIADEKIRYRPSKWKGDFIFVDGLNWSPAARYRIFNITSELIALGFDCCVLQEDELWRILTEDYRASIIHFFRAPYTDEYEKVVTKARASGSKIGFDIDDFVFDAEVMPYISGLVYLSPYEVEQYRESMHCYRRFIETADYVTTTTDTLASRIRRYNANVSLVVNSIGRDVWAPRLRTKTENELIRIGYYSGTNTHKADFATAAGCLGTVLRQHKNCVLRIVGDLDVNEFAELAEVNAQIERVGFMPYKQMLENMADCDVVIAPLEVGNPYCETKSELKYFEGVLNGCIVVASATEPFRKAINNGKTGFLIGKGEKWQEVLVQLVTKTHLRESVRVEALRGLRKNWHADVACKQFLHATGFIELVQHDVIDALEAAPVTTKAPKTLIKARVSDFGFVLPHIFLGSGGLRKLLRICYDLERAGCQVTLYVMGVKSASYYRDMITRFYFPIEGELFAYNGSVKQHAVLTATSWETAYVVKRHQKQVGAALYFVQDFEPMFMPVGTGYLRALATYKFGLRIITFGAWVANKVEAETGVKSVSIPFPLDKNVYFKPDGIYRKNKSVLYFARTSQERRAFELGCDALRIFSRANPDVEIGFFGEETYPEVGFHFTNHGSIDDLTQLADLYRNTHVGICFSPTNPSLVAYEMLACGAALVDLKLKGTDLNFGGADIAYLAEPEPMAIAHQIALAFRDTGLLQRRKLAADRLIAAMRPDDELAGAFYRAVTSEFIVKR